MKSSNSILLLIFGLAFIVLPVWWFTSAIRSAESAHASAPLCESPVTPSADCQLVGQAVVEDIYAPETRRRGRTTNVDLLVELRGPDDASHTAELADSSGWRSLRIGQSVTAEL